MSYQDSRGGDRGGNRYGGGSSGYKKFGGGGGKFGGRDGGRPQMHRATCTECNSSCEVPFKPTGDRPVFCNQCFKKGDNGGDFAPKKFAKRDYGDSDDRGFGNGGKKFGGSSGGHGGNAGGGANYDKQFAILNEKLDKILGAMEEMANMDDGDYDDMEDQDDDADDAVAMNELEEATPKKRRAKKE